VQIDHDDNVLMIKDGYPKARFHVLVIARDPTLLDISCLRAPQHLPLLTHMRSKAEAWFSLKKAEVGVVRELLTDYPAVLQHHFHWLRSRHRKLYGQEEGHSRTGVLAFTGWEAAFFHRCERKCSPVISGTQSAVECSAENSADLVLLCVKLSAGWVSDGVPLATLHEAAAPTCYQP
jgi:Scavenger mRNA decapping enzyme C-term binding